MKDANYSHYSQFPKLGGRFPVEVLLLGDTRWARRSKGMVGQRDVARMVPWRYPKDWILVHIEEVWTVFVAASTDCFPENSLPEVADLLADLEFTHIEIALREDGTALAPSRIDDEFERAVHLARRGHRLEVCSYDVHIDAKGAEYLQHFAAVCRLGKATKVVTLTVPSSELGTPFNEEVEQLQRLVEIADGEGVRVAMKQQVGRLSEDMDTVKVLCDNVKGLGLTLDPSHHLCGPQSNKSLDKVMPYVFHVHLRDSKKGKLQVRVGQGEIEYGRVIQQLSAVKYALALSIQIEPTADADQRSELRKLRLLLETLL